jgi:hypothetical protein|nr:MAG TPA: hypothetical protein [Caudoviricetes sp.]
MRRIFIILAIVFLFATYSCNTKQKNQSVFTTDSMQVLSPSDNLVNFFLRYKSYDANEVKEQMLIEQRNNELKKIIDSVGVFNNLKAVIYDIKVRNVNKNEKCLSYKLSIFDTLSKTEAWEDSIYMGFIELGCTHMIKGKDNYFMKRFSEIPEFGTVYVDGIFAVDNKTNMPKMFDETSQLIHPIYFFHTTDISTKELSLISKKLQKAILAGHKVFDYTFMGKGEFNKNINDKLIKDFEQAKSGLDKEDSLYLIRYMNEIMLDSPY